MPLQTSKFSRVLRSSLPNLPTLTREKNKISHKTTCFGTKLDPLILIIPPIMRACIEALEDEKSLETVGLFRVTADLFLLNVHKARWDEYYENQLLNIPSLQNQDPHIVANLLKHFIRELPEPFVPFHCVISFFFLTQMSYTMILEAGGIENEQTRKTRIKQTLSFLPGYNLMLLAYLVKFLTKVAAHSEKNKMDFDNIGIVFGPNILRQKDQSLDSILDDSAKVNNLFTFFLENYDFLFSDIVIQLDLQPIKNKFAPLRVRSNSLSAIHIEKTLFRKNSDKKDPKSFSFTEKQESVPKISFEEIKSKGRRKNRNGSSDNNRYATKVALDINLDTDKLDLSTEDTICKDVKEENPKCEETSDNLIHKDTICKDIIEENIKCEDTNDNLISKDTICKDVIEENTKCEEKNDNLISKDTICKDIIEENTKCEDTNDNLLPNENSSTIPRKLGKSLEERKSGSFDQLTSAVEFLKIRKNSQ